MNKLTQNQWTMFRDQIIWLMDNPSKCVWSRMPGDIDSNNGWTKLGSPIWRIHQLYVIDDQFAEFRKALVDNKEVLYNHNNHLMIVSNNHRFEMTNASDYKITEDKPNVKVGDWIVSGDDKKRFYSRATQDLINCWKNSLVKWEPELYDDNCVVEYLFWNDDYSMHKMHIDKLFQIHDDEKYKYRTVSGNAYECIAPLNTEFIEYLDMAKGCN